MSEPNSTDSRLVAFALRGDSPKNISTGKETAETEEAKVLIIPQANPASSRANP